VESFQFLIVGGLGAVGAALTLGTLAAVVRYWRTGRWPGEQDIDDPPPVTTGHWIGLWLRAVIGVALTVWAVVSLLAADLL
jgi:hypothetical protein